MTLLLEIIKSIRNIGCKKYIGYLPVTGLSAFYRPLSCKNGVVLFDITGGCSCEVDSRTMTDFICL